MLTPIPLSDCPGLIDLMLTGDEHCASFTLNGVRVSVERIGDAAYLEAACADFGLSVVVPGWYAGEHGPPAHVAIIGDAHTCMGWLPIEQANKLVLIQHLPFSLVDRMLSRLSI